MIELMLKYAKSQLGKPYIYGANGGGAYDCSGFVLEMLRSIGLIGRSDMTAQQIYHHFNLPGNHQDLESTEQGDLVFYGKGLHKISHVAMVCEDEDSFILIVEAGGGNASTATLNKARKQGAQIRIRPIDHRKDMIAILTPGGERK